MKPTHTPIILVSLLLAAAIAVSSSPFHQGWAVKYAPQLALTGAVGSVQPQAYLTGAATSTVPKPIIGTPTVTTSTTTPETIDIKQGFLERLLTGIFGELTEAESVPEPGCCADQQAAIDEMTDTVNDLQDKIDVLENRMNQPCASTTIRSGSCTAACQNTGLKCTGAMTIRTEVESHLIGSDTESILFTAPTDCENDWYMAFPEVYDERSCFCC
ncbi:hypothetical protein HY492_01625 [Candidatus Woesearchaeota archaeon]|nr:hypothetical protein [Candidatus Woesearchaeota archaeon]